MPQLVDISPIWSGGFDLPKILDLVWLRIFEINERIYRVLTLEFLSMLRILKIKGSAAEDSLQIHFHLGGVKREILVSEFTLDLDIYPPRFNQEHYPRDCPPIKLAC
ncbi:unnamed protein product [Linum trigynum]|uniref:Uncharacterized protein n=1 Tax=Linum trigynum TaxID=586398 RepID=A0AAV2DZN9_9ROSI